MRLIDADKIPFRKELGDMSDNPKMFVFKSDVDKIPTIDPASLRPKGEWISVEDRPPDVNKTKAGYEKVGVIVSIKNYKKTYYRIFERACVRDKTVYRWKYPWDKISDEEITHWMPLPKPPNTEVAHDS